MRPTDEVRVELEQLLAEDRTRLGDVYRGEQRGLDRRSIADELGVPTSNFVINQQAIMRAMFEGRLPSGPAIEGQVASALRTRLKRTGLSPEARAHLNSLIAELESRRRDEPTPLPPETSAAPAVSSETGRLREATDAAVRERLLALTARIESETDVGTDDYRSALSAPFALDGIAYLLLRNTSSATTQALLGRGTPELTLEHAVLDWCADLPIMAELISYASQRLKYWSS